MRVFAQSRAYGRAAIIFSTVAIAATLAGCSGGNPGANDVKQAAINNPQFMSSITLLAQLEAGMTGAAPRTAEQIISEGQVEVGTCVAATNASGVVCDFRTGKDGTWGGWTKARFFQAGGQWQMEQMQ